MLQDDALHLVPEGSVIGSSRCFKVMLCFWFLGVRLSDPHGASRWCSAFGSWGFGGWIFMVLQGGVLLLVPGGSVVGSSWCFKVVFCFWFLGVRWLDLHGASRWCSAFGSWGFGGWIFMVLQGGVLLLVPGGSVVGSSWCFKVVFCFWFLGVRWLDLHGASRRWSTFLIPEAEATKERGSRRVR